jgi:tetratricopeptide (TPR) repeat protein
MYSFCQIYILRWIPKIRISSSSSSTQGIVLFITALAAIMFISLSVGGCSKPNFLKRSVSTSDKDISKQESTEDVNWKENGIRLAGEGNLTEAFKKQVVDEPEDFFGFNAIGVCFKKMGDHSRAMKNYSRALEFADTREERAKVLSNIATLYLAVGKKQAALGYYKEASSQDESNPIYLISIARTFIVMNAHDRARKVLDEAERIHRNLSKFEHGADRGQGYYLMAYCFISLQEPDKAFKYLELALRENPAKYVRRIQKGMNDEKSLLFTLKEDPKLKRILKRYARKASPDHWVNRP